MKVSALFIIATFLFIGFVNCESQVRPFLFTTSPNHSDYEKLTLHFDAGVGNGGLGFSDASSADSRIGAEWNLNSRWMFLGNTAFGKDESPTVITGQIEGFYAFAKQQGWKIPRSCRRWSSLGTRRRQCSAAQIFGRMANATLAFRYEYDLGKSKFTGSRSS